MKLLNLLLLSPDLTTYILPQILRNQSKLYAIVKVLILRKQVNIFHHVSAQLFISLRLILKTNKKTSRPQNYLARLFYLCALSMKVFLFLGAVINTIAKLKNLSSLINYLSSHYPQVIHNVI